MESAMIREYWMGALQVVSNPKYLIYIIPALAVMEMVFCALIIRTTPYTEIDWVAYMQQIKQIVNDERDYTMIEGDTGPLVYPAMHVWIYRGLYQLTYAGTNITIAQVVFLFVYVLNLTLAMLCYWEAGAAPYIFPMLVLSKRLHSIYVLRCFNDCFAMTGFFLGVYMFQKRNWTYGTLLFSAGMGVKMNLLLALPAVGAILYQALGPWNAIIQVSNILQVQLLSALPFLQKNATGYLQRAFNLARVFKYEWTVNWRFVSEEVFLSRNFAIALLILHVSLLALFMTTRWLQPTSADPLKAISALFQAPTEEQAKYRAQRVTPDFILTAMLTSMVIGMLCARSLHYQFYAWLGWATPFLLWRSGISPIMQYIVWFGQELAWNIYPSNELSSKIVVAALAVVVVEVWVATDWEDEQRTKRLAKVKAAQVQATKQQRLKAQAPQARSARLEKEAQKILSDPDWPAES